jgi:hypothetical protein
MLRGGRPAARPAGLASRGGRQHALPLRRAACTLAALAASSAAVWLLFAPVQPVVLPKATAANAGWDEPPNHTQPTTATSLLTPTSTSSGEALLAAKRRAEALPLTPTASLQSGGGAAPPPPAAELLRLRRKSQLVTAAPQGFATALPHTLNDMAPPALVPSDGACFYQEKKRLELSSEMLRRMTLTLIQMIFRFSGSDLEIVSASSAEVIV